jgi:hypothetical protein
MLVINKGVNSIIVVTLTEKQLLTAPNYLFVFTGRTTNTQVKFVILNALDLSIAKNRYNRFLIAPSLFANAKIQDYIYNVYEQSSIDNLDPTGLNLLETGLMRLTQSATIFTEPSGTIERTIPS